MGQCLPSMEKAWGSSPSDAKTFYIKINRTLAVLPFTQHMFVERFLCVKYCTRQILEAKRQVRAPSEVEETGIRIDGCIIKCSCVLGKHRGRKEFGEGLGSLPSGVDT